MAKQRIGYFDIAKCIAVLFIVVGHTGLIYGEALAGGMPERLVHFAFTFHLPVFFIASGCFLKLDTKLDATFLKKSARNLLLPYVATCLLIIVLAAVVAGVMGADAPEQLIRWTQAAAFGAGAASPHALFAVERIGGVWFLLALFWAEIIVLAAQRLPLPGLWVCLSFVIGWASTGAVWLPWSIQSGLCAALFVYAGALARRYGLFDKAGAKANLALAVCAVVWLVYVIGPFGNMSFALFMLPSGMFDLVGSFCAAYVVFRLCRAWEHHGAASVSRFLELIGRNTLAIFCMHIVEDDALAPVWQQLIVALTQACPHAGWIVFLLIRLAVIALLCGLVYAIPRFAAVYFASRRKPVRAAAATVKARG